MFAASGLTVRRSSLCRSKKESISAWVRPTVPGVGGEVGADEGSGVGATGLVVGFRGVGLSVAVGQVVGVVVVGEPVTGEAVGTLTVGAFVPGQVKLESSHKPILTCLPSSSRQVLPWLVHAK